MDRVARTNWPVVVEEAAIALKRLHSVPAASCPFDNRLKIRLSTAHERVRAGHVDWKRFTSREQAASALAKLKRTAPRPEILVPTHGDPCLQNLLENRGRFAGFIDCGRTGLADRYHDLALACDSISECFGARWVTLFLRYYGINKPNQAKIEFYRRLDAFY
jgi:aminoglycoside 3'-phosphotransferase-2